MGSATIPTRHSAIPVLLHEMPVSTRKDLLGLASPSLPLETVRPHVTWKWLEELGFSIRKPVPEHWILTLGHANTEVHLYSQGELEQFARYKAHDYAERTLTEMKP